MATDTVVGLPVAYGRSVLEHSLALLATLATTDQLVTAWGDAPAGPAGEGAGTGQTGGRR